MSIVPRARRTTYFHDPFALDLPRPHFTAKTAASVPTTARMEWTQTPTDHIFKLDLPGVKREEVTIDLDGGRVLKITSEKWVEKEDRGDRWHCVERSRARFVTSFALPDNCKPHETEACMENGVLTIKVPKLEVWNRGGESTRIAVR